MPTWTILVADPDAMQRQLVDVLLAQEDFQLVSAANGRDTLGFLKEHTPSLAILALELPDIGGDAICRKLKAVTRLSKVPVILTTTQSGGGGLSTDRRELARAAGADLLLQKPLGDKSLRDRVNRLLKRNPAAEPAPSRGQSRYTTVVIEEALAELGEADEDTTAMDAVTEALYRENEELRAEVTSLMRRLARLESGMGGRREADPPATFLPGGEPAAPADPDPAAPAEVAGDRAEEAPDAAVSGATASNATASNAAASNAAAPEPGASGEEPLPAPARPGSVEGPAAPETTAETTAETTGRASAAEPSAGDGSSTDGSAVELRRRIGELERRNRALLTALEEAKAADDTPRRLFGRRRR